MLNAAYYLNILNNYKSSSCMLNSNQIYDTCINKMSPRYHPYVYRDVIV